MWKGWEGARQLADGIETLEEKFAGAGPSEVLGPLQAGLDAGGALGGLIEEVSEGFEQAVVLGGVEVPGGVAGDFGEGGVVGERDGAGLGHGFDGRDTEAFACGWEDECGGGCISGAELGALAVSWQADERGARQAVDLGLERGTLVGGAGADEYERERTVSDLRQACGGAHEHRDIFTWLKVCHREQVGLVVLESEVGVDGVEFGFGWGLEEEVISRVGDEGDWGFERWERLADLVGVELGD